jgi:hypothetical protein
MRVTHATIRMIGALTASVGRGSVWLVAQFPAPL